MASALPLSYIPAPTLLITASSEDERKLKPGAVAHTCNSSYSGGRDQEDGCSKSAWANSSQDPIFKTPITKTKGLVEWFKV
jgi:hypothetical protein